MPTSNYGKVVKSFTVRCAACGLEETYSDHVAVDDGTTHCYRGTAMMVFRRMSGWGTRMKAWLCPSCLDDYDSDDPWKKRIVVKRIESNFSGR